MTDFLGWCGHIFVSLTDVEYYKYISIKGYDRQAYAIINAVIDSPEPHEPDRPCFLPEDEIGRGQGDAEVGDETVDLTRAGVRALLENAGIRVVEWPDDEPEGSTTPE